ncbi:hypothetical protein IKF20_01680 [Candidatus Saccharibacteria bacterium]|nr:hypothetical protein [Candidatus Saccharibacteria bacterium]
MSVSLRLVHGSEKHLIGYTESDKQESYIKTYYENGVTSQMTFNLV